MAPSLIIILINVVSEPIYVANIHSVGRDYGGTNLCTEPIYVLIEYCARKVALWENAMTVTNIVGAVLQWAVVTTAGYIASSLKAMV